MTARALGCLTVVLHASIASAEPPDRSTLLAHVVGSIDVDDEAHAGFGLGVHRLNRRGSIWVGAEASLLLLHRDAKTEGKPRPESTGVMGRFGGLARLALATRRGRKLNSALWAETGLGLHLGTTVVTGASFGVDASAGLGFELFGRTRGTRIFLALRALAPILEPSSDSWLFVSGWEWRR